MHPTPLPIARGFFMPSLLTYCYLLPYLQLLPPFFPWAGKRKADDCKVDEGEPDCVFCKEGEEYTDKDHYSPKCRRCTFCDGGHGEYLQKQLKKTNLSTSCRTIYNAI